ncbi:MAG: hypothetical protein ACI4VC_04025 [Clostridia bacterium]
MKTNTTKTNVTSETKSTVKPVEKPVATKIAKTEKPVKTNETKTNKLYSFDEVMKLFDKYNIGSKSKTNNYRIMNGGSSLHVLKREYRLYATSVDFNAISDKNISDVKCIENDNNCDKLRPHTITMASNNALVEVLKILALNKLNAPC